MLDSEISIDCFAGGGGASTGITAALGASPAIAINHWPTALSVHAANHPETHHVTEDVWAVAPRELVAGRRVGVAWFSPDCTHFSRAKAGKPRTNKIRGLAWSVVRWASDVAPRVIVVENVPEFLNWGPIHATHSNGCGGATGRACPHVRVTGRGRIDASMPESDFNPVEDWEAFVPTPGCHFGIPDEARRGHTFRAWVRRLERLGYRVDWRVLAACDFGAPTTRRRLYVVARRDGAAPQWPAPTHGPGRPHPCRAAAEVIDWSLPLPSIFGRKKPLAEATLARISRGIKRFVIGERKPFLIHVSNGERVGQVPRIYDIDRPLGTVVAGGIKQALVVCFLARHFGGRGTVGSDLREPLRTVTAQDHHALVGAFLARHDVDPCGLQIVDIGMRRLSPRELARANGLPDDYVIDRGSDGSAVTITDQIRLIGNSVVPHVAEAIVRANMGASHPLHSRGAHGRQESLWT